MFIDGVEVVSVLQVEAFGIGFVSCLICDCVFSVAHFFLERALAARARRKYYNRFNTAFERNGVLED